MPFSMPGVCLRLAHTHLCIDTVWEEGWEFMWSSSAVSQASDRRAELSQNMQNILVTPNTSSHLTHPQTSILHPVTSGHFALWLSHIVVQHFAHSLYKAFSPSQELVWLAVILGVQPRSFFLSASKRKILWISASFPMTQLKHGSVTAAAKDWQQITGLCWGWERRTAQKYKTLW